MPLHDQTALLGLFQLGTNQLNTFENFLHSAVKGIQSSGVISGSMNVAYVIMLIGFLWEMYQSAMHGGDVKGLGKGMVKYLATALVVQSWPTVFVEVNQAFVSAGSWMTGQSGASNVLDTWMSSLKDQYSSVGFQNMWGLIAGQVAGFLDAIFIFIAYLLYPIVTVIFGFFYMMMGSILFVLGPLVIALLPLGAANRIAKSYVEHVFIWNAWPILYGALGLLITAVHLDSMSTVLASNGFLGALNGMEGSFLVGIISIVYSIAIAAIPFMAKSIVTGDVGSAARQMLSAATTAVAAGTAAFAGASAGVAAAKAGSSAGASSGGSGAESALESGGHAGSGNQPASPQPALPVARSSGASSAPSSQQPASAQALPSSASDTQMSPDESARNTGAPSSDSSIEKRSSGTPEGTGSETSPAEKAAQTNRSSAASDAQALRSIGADMNEGESRDGSAKSGPNTDMAEPASGTSDGSTTGSEVNMKANTADTRTASQAVGSPKGARQRTTSTQSSASARAPSPRHGIASWGAYHAARIAAHGAVSAGSAVVGGAGSLRDAIADPANAGNKLGSATGRAVGGLVRGAKDIGTTAAKGTSAVAHPVEAVQKVAQVSNSVREATGGISKGFTEGYKAKMKTSQTQVDEEAG